jgi:Tol biopolymer transport system component
MKLVLRFVSALSCPAIALIGGAAGAQLPSTVRVSVDSNGGEGDNNSTRAMISADDRLVAFYSAATDLVPGDSNQATDVFVHDRVTGATERVSVSNSGAQSLFGCSSFGLSISADGRFVSFHSYSPNFVAADTNGTYDVFVRDRTNATTECISLSTAGAPSNSGGTWSSISADGRYVAFESPSTNLVAGDTNGYSDVFVRDRVAGTTVRLSLDTIGAQGNNASSTPAISADGRFIAFDSFATNLVAGDTNGVTDIFVRDRIAGTTERVSVGPGGAQANGSSDIPSISADGRYVAFQSTASNLSVRATNGAQHVFVRDRWGGTTECVSVNTTGAQENASSSAPFHALSADGRFVSFWSSSTDIVAGDTNGFTDIFLRDRASASTERVSLDTAGAQGNSSSSWGSISEDGRFVAFQSFASNLVAGDQNGFTDVFLRDRGPQGPTVYCSSGTSSHGCNANIHANAHPSASFANPCNISVAQVEGQKAGILFYGLGRALSPWCGGGGGSSFLCVKAPTKRTGAQTTGGTFGQCDGALALDWNAYRLANPSALGSPWNVGSTTDVQAWYRDPGSCKTTSLSNALELVCVP